MVSFVSQEQRTVHRTIDEILETSREILTDDAVKIALGDTATQQVLVIDNDLYVPNNRHGVLVKPRGLRGDNHIPIFAAQPGDRTRESRVIFDSVHPRYLAGLASDHNGLATTDEESDRLKNRARNAYRRESQGHRSTTITNHNIARTHHITTSAPYSLNLPDKSTLLIDSKPLTTFNLAMAKRLEKVFLGAVCIHELVHILQTLNYPVEYDITRRELEAYHVGALVSKSLSDSLNPVFSGFKDEDAEGIEALRAYENQRESDMYHAGVRLRGMIQGL